MKSTADGKLPYFVKARIDRLLVDLGGTTPLTYMELADRMGMDKGALSKVVNGKQRVRLDTLQRIAEALGVQLSTLFDGQRPPITSTTELISLMTTYHQDILRALAELQIAESSAEPIARLLAAEDRRHRARQPRQARSK